MASSRGWWSRWPCATRSGTAACGRRRTEQDRQCEWVSLMRKSWNISRRTVLRGVGAAIALPWLEAMRLPVVSAAEGKAARAPLRTVFVYHPLGAETTAWKGVTGAGKDLKLTPTLAPLEPVKEHLL